MGGGGRGGEADVTRHRNIIHLNRLVVQSGFSSDAIECLACMQVALV